MLPILLGQARAGTDVVHSPRIRDRSWRRAAVRCCVHRALLHHERSLAAPGTRGAWCHSVTAVYLLPRDYSIRQHLVAIDR